MSARKIKDFESFVNESYYNNIDEGILSGIKKYGKTIFGWAYKLLKNILKGLIEPIPYGPKKGLPTIMLFLPDSGEPIYNQMSKYEEGIDPRKSGGFHTYGSGVRESELPIEYTQEDTVDNIALDAKDYIIESYKKKSNGDQINSLFIKDESSKKLGIKCVGRSAGELLIPVLCIYTEYINPNDIFRNDNLSINDILPTIDDENNRGGIILLEDFDKADRTIIDYFNNIVKTGETDGYKLPSKWIIVASGKNPELIGDLSGFIIREK